MEFESKIDTKDKDLSDERLEKFNWGAFFLTPFWAFGHNVGEWRILSWLPFFNIVASFHLGLNGNKLAFENSDIKSVDDFMFIQNQWKFWAISFMTLNIAALIILIIIW